MFWSLKYYLLRLHIFPFMRYELVTYWRRYKICDKIWLLWLIYVAMHSVKMFSINYQIVHHLQGRHGWQGCGFQYALIRNNRSKKFGVEYWALPGSNSPWRPWSLMSTGLTHCISCYYVNLYYIIRKVNYDVMMSSAKWPYIKRM